MSDNLTSPMTSCNWTASYPSFRSYRTRVMVGAREGECIARHVTAVTGSGGVIGLSDEDPKLPKTIVLQMVVWLSALHTGYQYNWLWRLIEL
jgi:hypothetical protein